MFLVLHTMLFDLYYRVHEGRQKLNKEKKDCLYEGGIRVPFIVNQPGMVPIQTLDNLIYFPDMMPTLAALAK